MHRKYITHACRSNVNGVCTACHAEGKRLGRPIKRPLGALSAFRAFLDKRDQTARACHGLARDAEGMGLASVTRALDKLTPALRTAPAPATLARLTGKLDTLRGEVLRASEARQRRAEAQAEREAKARAQRVAEQSALRALRVSQDATYRVFVKFARGAYATMIAREAPKGWREARASLKVRGNSLGFRFVEAETLRDNIERKLGDKRARRGA